MKKITKQDVDYIVMEENADHFIVVRLESPVGTEGQFYHLSKRKSSIFKDEDYEVSEFNSKLVV